MANWLPVNSMAAMRIVGPAVMLKMTSVSPFEPPLRRSHDDRKRPSSWKRRTMFWHATRFAIGLHGIPLRTPVISVRSSSLNLPPPM